MPTQFQKYFYKSSFCRRSQVCMVVELTKVDGLTSVDQCSLSSCVSVSLYWKTWYTTNTAIGQCKCVMLTYIEAIEDSRSVIHNSDCWQLINQFINQLVVRGDSNIRRHVTVSNTDRIRRSLEGHLTWFDRCQSDSLRYSCWLHGVLVHLRVDGFIVSSKYYNMYIYIYIYIYLCVYVFYDFTGSGI